MKQRISKDLTARRYDELRKGGMTRKQATLRMGVLLLNYYGIDYTDRKNLHPMFKEVKE